MDPLRTSNPSNTFEILPIDSSVEQTSSAPASAQGTHNPESRPSSLILEQTQANLQIGIANLAKELEKNPSSIRSTLDLKMLELASQTTSAVSKAFPATFSELNYVASGKVKAVYQKDSYVIMVPKGGPLDTNEIATEAKFAKEMKQAIFENTIEDLLKNVARLGALTAKHYANLIAKELKSPEQLAQKLSSKEMEWLTKITKDDISTKSQIVKALLTDTPEMHALLETGAYLALDMDEINAIEGKRAWVTQAAWGNLEEALRVKPGMKEKAQEALLNADRNIPLENREKLERKVIKLQELKPLTFATTVKLALQLIKANVELHRDNKLQGDSKPENALVFKKGNEWVVKLSDWGKSRTVVEGKTLPYDGNLRFVAPEGTLSKASEVYSLGLVLVRVLEEEFLGEGPEMLVDPGQLTDKSKLSALNQEKNRRGIERFVSTHQHCVQRDTTLSSRTVHTLRTRALSVFSRDTLKRWTVKTDGQDPAERAVHGYVDELQNKLVSAYPDRKMTIQALMGQIKAMLHSDPDQRPSAADVATTWEKLIKSL